MQQQDVCSCAVNTKTICCMRVSDVKKPSRRRTNSDVTFLNDPADSSRRLERTKNVDDEAPRSLSSPGSDSAATSSAVETNTHLAFLLAAMRGDPVRFGVGSAQLAMDSAELAVGSAELAVGSALRRPHLSVTTDALIQSSALLCVRRPSSPSVTNYYRGNSLPSPAAPPTLYLSTDLLPPPSVSPPPV